MAASRTALLAAVALVTAGCAAGSGAHGGRPVVVATTTQVADFAAAVAGDHAAVVRLLAPNTDPHEYEVRPRDVKALAGATLIVRSGGDVDDWLKSAIGASGTHARVVDLIERVHAEPRQGGLDPHWWQDPRNVEKAVAVIRDALVAGDPAHAAAYRANAARYETRVRRLDRAVAACIDRVPPARRKLVTTHDAFGYYAERYGIQIIGTVIPSLSTEAQPSAGAVAQLVATIRRAGVTAIYAESSVNPKLAAAIARETGAHVGPALWADSLGPPGSTGATYVRSVAFNTDAIAQGLGVRCSL